MTQRSFHRQIDDHSRGRGKPLAAGLRMGCCDHRSADGRRTCNDASIRRHALRLTTSHTCRGCLANRLPGFSNSIARGHPPFAHRRRAGACSSLGARLVATNSRAGSFTRRAHLRFNTAHHSAGRLADVPHVSGLSSSLGFDSEQLSERQISSVQASFAFGAKSV